jgi:hypothetical protein
VGKGAISSSLDRKRVSGVAAQPVSEWGSVLKVEMTTELRGPPSVQTGLVGFTCSVSPHLEHYPIVYHVVTTNKTGHEITLK